MRHRGVLVPCPNKLTNECLLPNGPRLFQKTCKTQHHKAECLTGFARSKVHTMPNVTQCWHLWVDLYTCTCTRNFTCSFHLLESYVHVYMYSNAAARLYPQYMPCVHLNDLRTNTCALVSRRALGTVGHVQWSVKVWGWQIVKLKDVTAVLNFTKREDMVVSQDSRVLRRFASCYPPLLYSSFLTWTSRGRDCIYVLCLLFHFRTSLLALPFSLASQLYAILMPWQWDC